MQIFISYSSKSRELINRLAKDLDDMGHEVWYDQSLTGGHKWWATILEQIRLCDVFMIALTPPYLESTPCRLEYEYAFILNKIVIPVILETVNTRLLPVEVQKLQWIDYQQRTAKAAMKLATTLTHFSPRPLPHPLPPEPREPLPQITFLQEQIGKPVLSIDEQEALVSQLRDMIKKPDYAADASELLYALFVRNDLISRLEYEISKILEANPTTNSNIKRSISETETQKLSATQLEWKSRTSPPVSNDSPKSKKSESGYDIFISYAREDREFLNRLVRDLKEHNITIWTDEALERGSKSFSREIKIAIKRAKFFVVICSPESEQSEWVEIEIALAQEFDKMIFPVLLRGEAGDAVPVRLITYQRYDLSDDYQKGFDKLIKALKANLRDSQ